MGDVLCAVSHIHASADRNRMLQQAERVHAAGQRNASTFDASPGQVTQSMDKVAKNFKTPLSSIRGLSDCHDRTSGTVGASGDRNMDHPVTAACRHVAERDLHVLRNFVNVD